MKGGFVLLNLGSKVHVSLSLMLEHIVVLSAAEHHVSGKRGELTCLWRRRVCVASAAQSTGAVLKTPAPRLGSGCLLDLVLQICLIRRAKPSVNARGLTVVLALSVCCG
jgi:hypothetical protein